MCSSGYVLVIVLLPKSFYLEKVMVLKGGCRAYGWVTIEIFSMVK
jgi:hypothetical protein